MEIISGNYEELLSGLEIGRHRTLRKTLSNYAHLFKDKHVLDYGASRGLSAEVMISLGAASVTGVEIDFERVETGTQQIAALGLADKIHLIHLEDTTRLPFDEGQFEFVLSNAVFEHIPQPRQDHLRAAWRVLAQGGHFLLTETPNKYWPYEGHTTGLWFNHWLPKATALARARRRGKTTKQTAEWEYSGWRGLGYFELVAPLERYKLIPESSKLRHKVLTSIGIPASILDPYPEWLLQKV